MADQREINEPGPTIVGPRPPDGGTGKKVTVPRGMEKLLALAAVDAEWRVRLLADAPGAAAQAGIELSESERTILKSVPAAALTEMIASFARRSGRIAATVGPVTGAAAAAAALLATTLGGCGDNRDTPVGGIRPDRPVTGPKEPAEQAVRPDPAGSPAIAWQTALEPALAQARQAQRPLVLAFGSAAPSPAAELGAYLRETRALAVQLTEPVRPAGTPGAEAEQQFAAALAAWQATLRRYDVAQPPALVFLAPDGAQLAVVAQPGNPAQLAEAVAKARVLLQTWPSDRAPAPPKVDAPGGVRADVPPPRDGR